MLWAMFIFALPLSVTFSQSEKKWETRFESSGFISTSRYDESMAYFTRFARETSYAKFISIGKSPQNRDLNLLIVSKDKAFTPSEAKKTGKPVVLIVNGIHAGEIEGKDASMLLTRDILITKNQQSLIDNAILLVLPIFSVDGHERFDKFNRINQNGPDEMGWRTTAQNLNLNRDWLKADAPEMQALLKLIAEWLPDFLIDTHTTDGADYQYSLTYGIEKYANLYAGTSRFVNQSFIPFMENRVHEKGFLVAPYVGFKEGEPKTGLVDYAAPPRFSTGYAAVQNRIGILVETHMLKPYKERVFATKAILEATIEFVNANAEKLVSLDKEADQDAITNVSKAISPLYTRFNFTPKTSPYHFHGVTYHYDSSAISGTRKTVYGTEKFDEDIPYYNDVIPQDSVLLPFAYLVPREWSALVDRIRLHGVQVGELNESKEMQVTRYKFKDVTFATSPYEGHQGVTCKYDTFVETEVVPSGMYIIYCNQRTARVIGHLLEPKSGDSFLRWGYMNSIFERKEYFEDYVMEKVALQMLESSPALRKEFETKLAVDTAFVKSPNQRLNFFYERSPYFDKQQNLYPVMRIEKPVGIKVKTGG